MTPPAAAQAVEERPHGIPAVRSAVNWLRAHVIAVVVDVLIIIVLAALVWAVWQLALHVWELINGSDADAFKVITTEVLSVFIFIEIFQTLVEYLKYH
ncbi:MAG: hypothetical protein FDZ75_04300, partial [Actinobacteria bacterium]